MDFLDSLSTSLFGITVVFLALISLIVLINIQGRAVTAINKNQEKKLAATKAIAAQTAEKSSTASTETSTSAPAAASEPAPLYSGPMELKLTGVDEKTAAMIMAIICDESDIPANELYFKSIKALD